MKIFISSVTWMLREERDALPPFLRLFDHQPLRFEDFQAQDRSSREACLAGVDTADVYILLLGPKYGEPFADSGLAPTEEEFRLAQNRGIPILVFNKSVDEPVDPAQQAFKDHIGHYVNGRFWKSFTDPLSLNQAVGEALKTVKVPGQSLKLRPVTESPTVPWLSTTGLVPKAVVAPMLELHLIPGTDTYLAGASSLSETARSLARDLRSSRFVDEQDSLSTGSDNLRAWAFRQNGSAGGRQLKRTEAFRGVILRSDGAATAFLPLATDFLGALVDQISLQQDMAMLLGLLSPHVDLEGDVVLAVALSNADQVREGDPREVGPRNSGPVRTQVGRSITVEPTVMVSGADLRSRRGDVVTELAIRLLNELRAVSDF